MAAKLESILKPIPWSLPLKALGFGLAWHILPYWVFLFAAAILYFRPFFRPRSLIFPFVLVLILAAVISPGTWSALFLAVVFFLILGIKDLIFVDRASAGNILVLLLYFAMLFEGYLRFDYGLTMGSAAWFFGTHAALYFLLRGYMRSSRADLFEGHNRKAEVLLALVCFLLFQIALALAFLPLGFTGQSAFLFLAGAVALEALGERLSENLTRNKILTYFSILFVAAVYILTTAVFDI